MRMTTQFLTEHRLQRALKALELEKTIQRDWLEHGIDFVNLYIEDVEGNWLDSWDEEEDNNIWFEVSQGLKDNFNQDWQEIDAVFDDSQRKQIYQLLTKYEEPETEKLNIVKTISLESNLVGLLVFFQRDLEDKFSIVFQLYPLEKNTLPVNTKLSLLDEKGNLGQPFVTSKEGDSYLEIKFFKATIGTRFKIEVNLEEITMTEGFIL